MDPLWHGVAAGRQATLGASAHSTARSSSLPTEPDAKVAAAVGRFDKDDPSAAFSRLGPLAREIPGLRARPLPPGVLLLWIRDVKDARAQLEKAAATMPESLYSREAKSLLSRLEGIGT